MFRSDFPARVVLASASPRRQELLKLLVPEFVCCPADTAEILPEGLPLEQGPEVLAEEKARAVAALYPDAIVLGSDTGVFLDQQMLGKPADRADAANMLRSLSGRTHQVITGCCLVWGSKVRRFSQHTQVEFYPLTEEEIQGYLATGEPFDKAGAYGIQGFGSVLVKEIRGDYHNVVGLPVSALARELDRLLEE